LVIRDRKYMVGIWGKSCLVCISEFTVSSTSPLQLMLLTLPASHRRDEEKKRDSGKVRKFLC
jgi:hypothetical protein